MLARTPVISTLLWRLGSTEGRQRADPTERHQGARVSIGRDSTSGLSEQQRQYHCSGDATVGPRRGPGHRFFGLPATVVLCHRCRLLPVGPHHLWSVSSSPRDRPKPDRSPAVRAIIKCDKGLSRSSRSTTIRSSLARRESFNEGVYRGKYP